MREQTEKIIDRLYEPLKDKLKKKPRTYREKAIKDYLSVAKKRRPTQKKTRKAIKKQLQNEYVFLDRVSWDNFNESDNLKKPEFGITLSYGTMEKPLPTLDSDPFG